MPTIDEIIFRRIRDWFSEDEIKLEFGDVNDFLNQQDYMLKTGKFNFLINLDLEQDTVHKKFYFNKKGKLVFI